MSSQKRLVELSSQEWQREKIHSLQLEVNFGRMVIALFSL